MLLKRSSTKNSSSLKMKPTAWIFSIYWRRIKVMEFFICCPMELPPLSLFKCVKSLQMKWGQPSRVWPIKDLETRTMRLASLSFKLTNWMTNSSFPTQSTPFQFIGNQLRNYSCWISPSSIWWPWRIMYLSLRICKSIRIMKSLTGTWQWIDVKKISIFCLNFRCNIIDRVKCPLLITSNGDTSIASGVSEFKPLMRVWDLSESEPDFYLTVCDSARISHNFLFVYLKTDSEKVFTLLTCEPGNFQGLMSAICQNFTVSNPVILFPKKYIFVSFLHRLMQTTFKTFSSWIAKET